jgi:phospholipid/cholesterol/gamma-HCH transport system permease protein
MLERVLNILSLGIFQNLGKISIGLMEIIEGIGSRVLFLWKVIQKIFARPFEIREFIVQLYLVGVQSLGIVAVSGFFVGGIVALQFGYALGMFGAKAYLGGVTTSGLLREVGPVLVAVMITGRIGAYISAEMGTMKVTEQIDALRCLGLDPMPVLVVPRFLAVLLMVFLLTIFGLLVSLLGGAVTSYFLLDINFSYYLVNLLKLTTLAAFLIGIIKSFIFGVFIATIACFEGYHAEPGAEGVGRAVNHTLVYASISIYLVDYIVAALVSITFTLAQSIIFTIGV